jgi:hypothetical protein
MLLVIRRILCIQLGLLLSAISSLCTHTNPHIIFVHIGDTIPAYTYVALEQARLFNEDAHLYLIANQKAIKNSPYDFNRHAIITVTCESLPRSRSHKKFNKETTLDPHGDRFWRKATERFFYIDEYVALHDLTQVVHIENDTMLYANIAEMHDGFSRYKGIGAIFDCDRRCIASLVYIADKRAVAHLVHFLAKHASKGCLDMEMIAEYRKAFSKDRIDNLPLVMPEYLIDHQLINVCKWTALHPLDYCKNSDIFNSIFDGAAIGQYLGGIDPRCGRSEPGFINESSLLNPSYLTIEWHRDIQNRNVPFASCHGKLYRINNLHIHSKFLENFRS